MKICAKCSSEVDAGREMSRRATCRKCGADLHICLNCRFHSSSAHNQCLEPKAEQQRYRDKANFCDYFQYKEGRGSAGSDDKDKARKALDDLFK